MNLFKKYFADIYEGINSSIEGLGLTLAHLFQARKRTILTSIASKDYFSQETGIVTLEYPFQSFPIPDNGRYRLHNEIDDCIVCDKCAKICPVDCIDITSIRSAEEIGLTSDGSSKRLYAATFDIDMAKCCFCGLCTTVCPTECLTMTPTYDFSEFDITNMVYHFTDLTPEEAKEKQSIFETKQAEKAAAAAKSQIQADNASAILNNENSVPAKPVFKPKFPTPSVPDNNTEEIKAFVNPVESKPVFRPKMPGVKSPEPVISSPEILIEPEKRIENTVEAEKPVTLKPVFKPKIPGIKTPDSETSSSEISSNPAKMLDNSIEVQKPVSSKPIFRPKIPGINPSEPVASTPQILSESETIAENIIEAEKPVTSKTVFKPKMKPVIPPNKEEDSNNV